MANGFGGLYIGVSGLHNSQNAINTTSHNITNVNTTGYTRQQVVFSDAPYDTVGGNSINPIVSGLGVNVQEVRRCRDEFLDASYRLEMGRLGFYESQYDVVNEVESQFGELTGVKFQEIMTNLKSSVNELALSPMNAVARTSLVQSAVAFVDRAKEIRKSLSEYQQTLNTNIENMVADINDYAKKINALNKEILKIENGGEHANDLRDQRDELLDSLGSLAKITYSEQRDGTVEVLLEGNTLVSTGMSFDIILSPIEGTNLTKPVWEISGQDVFEIRNDIATGKNNDIGKLKGLLLARGEGLPTYEDIQGDSDKEYLERVINKSILMKTVANFDKLVNTLVEDINNVLCPEKEMTVTLEDGTTVTGSFLDMDKTSYGMDQDKTVGEELFKRTSTDRYKKVTGADGNTYYMRNNTNVFGNESKYTIANLEVNQVVLDDVGKIPLTSKTGEEEFTKTEELLDLWGTDKLIFDPSTYAKENYETFYNSVIYDLALTGELMKDMTAGEKSMTEGLDSRRQEVAGVSSDEELTNLIRFQNAYNASSRYITAVNEMLEQLMNKLGG